MRHGSKRWMSQSVFRGTRAQKTNCQWKTMAMRRTAPTAARSGRLHGAGSCSVLRIAYCVFVAVLVVWVGRVSALSRKFRCGLWQSDFPLPTGKEFPWVLVSALAPPLALCQRSERLCTTGAPKPGDASAELVSVERRLATGFQPSAQSSIHWDEPSGGKEYRSWHSVVQNHASTETSSAEAAHGAEMRDPLKLRALVANGSSCGANVMYWLPRE